MTSLSQLLPGHQKSTQTFWMCHIVYFNNVKRNLGHLSCTRGPPQPKDYVLISAMSCQSSSHMMLGHWCTSCECRTVTVEVWMRWSRSSSAGNDCVKTSRKLVYFWNWFASESAWRMNRWATCVNSCEVCCDFLTFSLWNELCFYCLHCLVIETKGHFLKIS